MRGRASQSALFRSVGTIRVFTLFKIEAYFIKTFLRNKIFAFWTEVTAVYNGVNELIRMRTQITGSFDAADALEAEGVPNAA